MKLTNRGKAVIVFIVIFAIAFIGYKVTTTSLPPDCEHLYNEYTNTTTHVERDVLWSKGVNNGCFHYN